MTHAMAQRIGLWFCICLVGASLFMPWGIGSHGTTAGIIHGAGWIVVAAVLLLIYEACRLPGREQAKPVALLAVFLLADGIAAWLGLGFSYGTEGKFMRPSWGLEFYLAASALLFFCAVWIAASSQPTFRQTENPVEHWLVLAGLFLALSGFFLPLGDTQVLFRSTWWPYYGNPLGPPLLLALGVVLSKELAAPPDDATTQVQTSAASLGLLATVVFFLLFGRLFVALSLGILFLVGGQILTLVVLLVRRFRLQPKRKPDPSDLGSASLVHGRDLR